jgi:hypothetical protein
MLKEFCKQPTFLRTTEINTWILERIIPDVNSIPKKGFYT